MIWLNYMGWLQFKYVALYNLQPIDCLNQFQAVSKKQGLSFVMMSLVVVPALKYSAKSAEDDSNYFRDLRAT